MNDAPIATGIITNSNVFAPKIAIIGFAPAGGWIVLVICIAIIAILGAKTFEFVIMPVAIGASFIVIFALIYNKIWNR